MFVKDFPREALSPLAGLPLPETSPLGFHGTGVIVAQVVPHPPAHPPPEQ